MDRLNVSLAHALGPLITEALENPTILEVMVNNDGNIWIEEMGQPMVKVGDLPATSTATVISLVASSLEELATKDSPIVEGELPLDGSRFEGLLPPCVSQASFTIRKKASRVFTLDEYVSTGVLSEAYRKILDDSVKSHKNILVIGGTGSGKTTLVNGILHAFSMQTPEDRIVLIEDTAELQCSSPNTLTLRSTVTTPITQLVRATMRLRPDRIVVGEVRGGEALDLLKAWNTGHPGGVSTVHADSALEGINRLELLIAEVTHADMSKFIASAIDLVVFIEKTNEGRRISEILKLVSVKDGDYVFE